MAAMIDRLATVALLVIGYNLSWHRGWHANDARLTQRYRRAVLLPAARPLVVVILVCLHIGRLIALLISLTLYGSNEG